MNRLDLRLHGDHPSEFRGFVAEKGFQEHSADDWREWLEDILPDFIGNFNNAGELMYSATQGYIYETNKQRGSGSSFLSPGLVVLVSDNPHIARFFHSQGNIFITQAVLEQYSRRKPSDLIIVESNGEDMMETTPSDYFGINLVEEVNHAIRKQIQGIPYEDSLIDPRVMRLAEYDAIDHEFEGLQAQLAFAIERRLHPRTIKSLRFRIAEAEIVRQRKK